MTQTLIRYAVSIALGVALALPLVAVFQLPVAHATEHEIEEDTDNELSADSLLSDDFRGSTGLGEADLETTIGNIINVVLGFLGIVAVVIVLLGGFKWMTAGGNDEKVAEAKKLLVAGVIGLAIILSAYAITSFVISSLITASA